MPDTNVQDQPPREGYNYHFEKYYISGVQTHGLEFIRRSTSLSNGGKPVTMVMATN